MSRYRSFMERVPRARILPAIGLAAAIALPLAAQTAPPQPSREIVMTVGKSLVINSTANVERVAVGFGEIAEARAVGPRELLLDAKAPGETSLIVWQEGGNKLFFDVVVQPNRTAFKARLETLQRQLAEELPGQPITASLENDMVFLRGTAKDMMSAGRALAIAGAVGKVANLLYVEAPAAEAQVLLKVQFATVDRNLTTELGANLISTGATNTIGRLSTGQFGAPVPTAVSSNPAAPTTFTLNDALNIFLFRPDLNLGATIKALETRGLAEILAEPNVLAINGKPASFLSGGEFPYPILQGGQGGVGTVTVAFREFGVRIGFLPVVTPRGTIRLDVAPEVSALDYTAGLTVQGFTIPGLATRRVETEVELKAGQSFAIGGLLDRRLNETIAKVPLLGDIPLLGKLFQSKSLTRQNNELLVIITPEIVKPVPAGCIPSLGMPRELWGGGKAPQTPCTGSATASAEPLESLPYEALLQQMKREFEMKLQKGSTTATWPGSAPLSMPGLNLTAAGDAPATTPAAASAASAPAAAAAVLPPGKPE